MTSKQYRFVVSPTQEENKINVKKYNEYKEPQNLKESPRNLFFNFVDVFFVKIE